MTKRPSLFASSGWTGDLTPKAHAEIDHRLGAGKDADPRLDAMHMEQIELVAGEYVRMLADKPPTPAEAREEVEKLQKRVAELRGAFDSRRLGHIEDLIDLAGANSGTPDALSDLRRVLPAIYSALAKAREMIPEEHPITAAHWLVYRLARIVEDAGFAADGTPSGALVVLVGIIMEHQADQRHADVRKIVVRALQRRGGALDNSGEN